MAIAIFFVSHWFLSLFGQTFFLHRYASHRMFRMSLFWERFFFLVTFVTQGSSYLQPRAYAIMHRLHHAHSDTEDDPHSPQSYRTVLQMMVSTFHTYRGLIDGTTHVDASIARNIPEWRALDRIADPWPTRVLFMALYATFYFFFATQWWMWLLLPIHFVMGPVHGAIVNWCGHKYGYVNFRKPTTIRRTHCPSTSLPAASCFRITTTSTRAVPTLRYGHSNSTRRTL